MRTKKILISSIVSVAALFSTMSFANHGPMGHTPMNPAYHQHPNRMRGHYYPNMHHGRIIVINRGYYNPYYARLRHRPIFEFHFGR